MLTCGKLTYHPPSYCTPRYHGHVTVRVAFQKRLSTSASAPVINRLVLRHPLQYASHKLCRIQWRDHRSIDGSLEFMERSKLSEGDSCQRTDWLYHDETFYALRVLLNAKRVQRLWIDAIIINRSDHQESKLQIGRMGSIYELLYSPYNQDLPVSTNTK